MKQIYYNPVQVGARNYNLTTTNTYVMVSHSGSPLGPWTEPVLVKGMENDPTKGDPWRYLRNLDLVKLRSYLQHIKVVLREWQPRSRVPPERDPVRGHAAQPVLEGGGVYGQDEGAHWTLEGGRRVERNMGNH